MLKDLIKRMKSVKLVDLSIESGIHYNQLWRLQKGGTINPQLKTINRVLDAIERIENGANNTPTK